MSDALASLYPGPGASRRVPISLALLALIALACVLGPMVSPHPYDRVYPDYVFADPSLAPHPTAGEAKGAIEDIARRMGASIASLRQDRRALNVTLIGERPIDARDLRVFERSDVFAAPRVEASEGEGRRLTLDIPLQRNLFLFGTDANGRDLLTRTLIAGRVSLAVGLLASFVALVIGVGYGAIAGIKIRGHIILRLHLNRCNSKNRRSTHALYDTGAVDFRQSPLFSLAKPRGYQPCNLSGRQSTAMRLRP